MIPTSHPRYLSLKTRDLIVEGVEKGITSIHGLIAQGRGESFDYLIGEKTNDFAIEAISAALAMLLLAKHPVISVNGNVAALVRDDIIKLSKKVNAKIEINIFHTSKQREHAIKNYFLEKNVKVLMPDKSEIKYMDHNRRFVNKDGIFVADVVFVPLEDGDRCEALIKNGKKVITVDLNPMSRTSKTADITIVDNIVRVLPLMNNTTIKNPEKILKNYDNKIILKNAVQNIRN